MGALILRATDSGHVSFRCPGCGDVHTLAIAPDASPRWTYNGNPEQPTFHPSIMVTSGHHTSGYKAGAPCWCTFDDAHPHAPSKFSCYRCHSFVREGRIEFLSDCTHSLAGQTVDLQPWDADGIEPFDDEE